MTDINEEIKKLEDEVLTSLGVQPVQETAEQACDIVRMEKWRKETSCELQKIIDEKGYFTSIDLANLISPPQELIFDDSELENKDIIPFSFK